MFQAVKFAVASLLLASAVNAAAQSGYQVVSLTSSGTIVGTVKWSGQLPRLAAYPITKDPAICDPDSHKTRDLAAHRRPARRRSQHGRIPEEYFQWKGDGDA